MQPGNDALAATSRCTDLPPAGAAGLQGSIAIEGRILEGQFLDKQGHEVRVIILKGGRSNNGFVYDQAALQQIARLVEGAQAYADHNTSVPVRSVKDIVGFYKNATYMPPDSTNLEGRVDATLHILEAASWLWDIIYESVQLGMPNLIGLSIDIFGNWHTTESKAKQVTSIHALNSCDIVTRPSAGGSFQRILHANLESQPATTLLCLPSVSGLQGTYSEQGELPHMHSTQGTPPIDTQEQLTTPQVAPPAANPPTSSDLTSQSRLLEQQQLIEAQRAQMEQLLQQTALERCGLQLERRLIESILPEAVKTQLRTRFAGRIYEAGELEREMTAALTMMADLSRAGLIRGHGFEKAEISQQITEAEKIQAAFDLMFEDSRVSMLSDTEKAKFAGVKAFGSIREAYVRATGDTLISGVNALNLGQIRVSEHAPIPRITEADTTTASFSYLLGTSMNKRLLKDYQAWPAEWQRFCTITPIKDFKQQSRVRLGAFGSLSTVAEDTPYTTITLTDTAATYVPTKRGNLVTISREAIINDDLFAIKQIPTKLAVAAAYTLAEFVYSFLSTNPTIYDGNALFTSGAPHSNLGSSNLSTAAMQAGVTAMREQTNFAGKRIGLRPKYLVVPAELEFVAMVVTKSAGVPGSNNNDINPMLGYVTPIVSPQLTNTTQWFLIADPMVVDTIEVGFVGGQVNPVLLIQDSPLYGLNFTQDAVSFKVRHEYGSAVMDYRGLYRGV